MGVSVFPEVIIPAGMIMPSARSDAPSGWLLCNGTAVSRTTYTDLFVALGTTYGAGDGSTTFNLPNLKGRVIVGVDAAQTEFDALGETGGSKTSTAPHTHDLANHTHTLGTHSHTMAHTHAMENHRHSLSDHRHGLENHTHTGGNHSHAGGTGVHAHSVLNVVYVNGAPAHGHDGGAGQLAERPNATTGFGASGTTNTTGQQNTGESPETGNPNNYGGWAAPNTNLAGYAQDFTGGQPGASNSTTTGPTGGSDTPSSNTSGASSAALASGNLQPYMALNYLIKT